MPRLGFAVLVFLIMTLSLGAPRTAQAAESYDNCTGFITSLPAVITTQGTWCLKKDLATAMTSGSAIDIQTNNVMIDCNDFKLGGLAAGATSEAAGIDAKDRLNLTVRHCNIRGFFRGLIFWGTGGGHVVEDNRFDGNLYAGLEVWGDGSVVRRNRIFDTGGSVFSFEAFGMYSVDSVDILDNTVSGVTNDHATGIWTDTNSGGSVSGNRVRNLLASGGGIAVGIYTPGSDHLAIRDNDLGGNASAGSIGIECFVTSNRALGNVIAGFATGISGCSDDGGNVIAP
jgi:hypothetical protein